MKSLAAILLFLVMLLPLRLWGQSGDPQLIGIIATQLSTTTIRIDIDLSRENRRGLFGLYRAVNDEGLHPVDQFHIQGTATDTTILSVLPSPLRCSDSVRFWVKPEWDGSQSNVATILNNDNTPTSPTQQGVATVDEATQKIRLTWDPNPDTDIMGYYLCSGNPCLDYDTVWGRLQTTYMCQDYSPLAQHVFRLLAFDSCMNPSPLTEPFGNLVLALQSADCSPQITLSWNPYQGMPGGVDHYELEARFDSNPWHLEQQLTATTATLTVPNTVSEVSLRVKAVNGTHSLEALSNIVTHHPATSANLAFIHISHASVMSSGRAVHLAFHLDGSFPSSGYRLYRAEDNAPFHRVAIIPYSGQDNIEYIDHSLSADQHIYRYQLSSPDECGTGEKYSSIVATSRLAISDEGYGVQLQWSPYQGWGVTPTYEVLRRMQDEETWTSIGQTSTTDYLDDFSLSGQPTQGLYYRILAHEPPQSQYALDDTAFTAQQLFKRPGTIYFPNAFTPSESTNNTFYPSYTYLDEDDYYLAVYDRRGQLVFYTTDPKTSWDGTHLGQPLPQGTYVYTARCHFLNHTLRQPTGTVLLLR